MKKRITADDVKKGFPISSPLTVYDCSLMSDGAAFLVLAATEVARGIAGHRAVEVIGSGHAGDTTTIATKGSITTFAATVRARNEAFKMAGIGPQDVNLAEVHDCFTITQIFEHRRPGLFRQGRRTAGGAGGQDGPATARSPSIPAAA